MRLVSPVRKTAAVSLCALFELSLALALAPAIAGAEQGGERGSAAAQSEPAPERAPADESEAAAGGREEPQSAIEEIVVTARKREEGLQETPVAISAWSGARLDELGSRDLVDVGKLAPNVVFNPTTSGGSASIYVRGVGQRDSIQFLDPGVGVYVDGVYLARAAGSLLSTIDVERVEVLRGPQGTLYGKNTIGGAVNFVTRKPGPQLEGLLQGRVGNFGRFGSRAMLNVPVVEDRLFARVALASERREGFTRNVARTGSSSDKNDDSLYAAVGSLRWLPDESLRVDLLGSFSREHERGRASRCTLVDPQNFVSSFVIQSGGFDLVGACAGAETRSGLSFGSNLKGQYDLETRAVHATLTWDGGAVAGFDDLTLKSVSSWRAQELEEDTELDATELPVLHVRSLDPRDQFQISQELQVSAAALSGLLHLTAGAYAFWEETEDGFLSTQIGPDGSLPTLFGDIGMNEILALEIDNRSYAGYGQASYDLLDWLQLTGGVRFTHESKALDRIELPPPAGSPAPTGPLPRKERFADTFAKWTPMASVRVRADDWLADTPIDGAIAYLTWSEGFKSGGFSGRENPLDRTDRFDQEEVESVELGVKLSAFQDRLTVNSAVFHSEYTDIQLTTVVVDASVFPVEVGSTIKNAGQATIWGAEIEVAGRLAELLLTASAGYTDAEYDEFDDTIADFLTGAQTPVDRSGEDFFQVPRFTINASAEYRLELSRLGWGEWGSLTPRIAMYMQDSTAYHFTPQGFASGRFEQGRYTLYDVRLTWDLADDRTRIALYGENVFDRRYFVGAIDLADAFGLGGTFVAQPRTYGIEASYRF